MDAILARYIDGELTDQEARTFLESVENDPALEKELRDYEQVLYLGGRLKQPRPPAGFTGRVMRRISGQGSNPVARSSEDRPRILGDPPIRGGLFGWRWPAFAMAAAAVMLAYAGGWWFGRQATGPAAIPGSQPGMISASGQDGISGAIQPAAAGENRMRYVRLIYVPREASVEQVHVAGSFNGWDAASSPLKQQNGVWSTVLVLPPGSYEYMFIENGNRWVTDPLAARTRDDGFGGSNAVLDVEI